MKHDRGLRHEFVDFIPDELDQHVIYISIRFATATHLCCCGCGNKVVTPITPTDWTLSFNGKTISLDPSIGNWSFACRSHYWIWNNRVQWAPQWSTEQIALGRAYDQASKQEYFRGKSDAAEDEPNNTAINSVPDKPKWSVLRALMAFWR